FIFRKVVPRVAGRIASAKQDRRHIEAVENDRLVLSIFIGKFYVGERCKGRHKVEATDNVVVPRASLDFWTPSNGRHAVATFTTGPFGPTKRSVTRVRVHILPSTVIGGPKHISVLVESQRPHFVHYTANTGVSLDYGVGKFGFCHRLLDKVGMRQIWLVNLHEIDAHEERLRRTSVAIEIVERRSLDISVQIRNADNALLRRIDVFTIDFELLTRRLPGVARKCTFRHPLKHVP